MILRCILILAMLVAPGLCQTKEIKTKILTISLSVETPEAFFMSAGKVEAYAAERSGLGTPFSYEGIQNFILRASAEEFSPKDPMPAPLASVMLPQQAKLVLIVSSKSEKGLKLRAYDISAEGFGAGDYRFFNFSENNTILQLSKKKITLKAGEDQIVSNAFSKDKVMDVTIQIAHVDKGKAKRVYASSWGYQPVKRNFIFLFNGNHASRPVAIRRYSDRPE